MKQQQGFTLIELIMVIVILGILAATALPKFVNLGMDARAAAIKAVDGSMRSANAIIYAKAAIGNALGANSSVSVAGQTVTTKYGFAATVADLVKVMDINTTATGDFDIATVTTEIQHKGGATPGSCKVAYTVPAAAESAPAYTTTTTGC